MSKTSCPDDQVKQIEGVSCTPCGTPTPEGYPTEMVAGGCLPVCPDTHFAWMNPYQRLWTCVPKCKQEGMKVDYMTGRCYGGSAETPQNQPPSQGEGFPWNGVLMGIGVLGAMGLYLRSARSSRR